MKNMKKNIRRLLACVLVLFAVLGVYSFYTVSAYGGRWFSTPYNTRLRRAKDEVIPGNIYDRSGILLATSTANGERSYPASSSATKSVSHVLGDPDGLVPTGAETMFAAELLGFRSSVFDRFSQLFKEKRRGSDITLSVSAELSKYVREQFPDGHNGAVAILNYKTGEVYTLYSNPEFDLNNPAKAAEDEESGALINRASQGRYAPGSIFKVVTLACALENMPNVQGRSFECTGHMQVTDEISVTDTDGEGHGTLTFEEAFTKSCNITYATLALELGESKLRKTAQNLGFNGNFLFPEIIVYESLFPASIEDKGELAWTGVGQGKLMVSPLHMAMIAGSIANGGTMVVPQMLRGVRDNNANVQDSLAASNYITAFNRVTANTIKDMMVDVVKNGTGTRAAVSGHLIGGKTGTAQVNSSGGRYQPHSWYIGFCAEDDHPYAIAVIVENGGSGSGAAARLAGKAIKKAIDLGL